mgnify:CR=1 FL=1
MRRIFLLTIFAALTMVQCSNSSSKNIDATIDSSAIDYDYLKEMHVNWFDILNLSINDYYVYIYSKSCGHCNQIKETILNYALDDRIILRFCEFTDEIPLKSSINPYEIVCSIDDIGILGTPTLLHINNSCLIYNLAGSNNIVSYLTSIL